MPLDPARGPLNDRQSTSYYEFEVPNTPGASACALISAGDIRVDILTFNTANEGQLIEVAVWKKEAGFPAQDISRIRVPLTFTTP